MRERGSKGLYSRGDTGGAGLVAGYGYVEERRREGQRDELGRAEVDTELTDWTVLADVR